MEKSSFFNSINHDRKYKASTFAEYFNSFIGNGVFPNPSTNLQAVANSNNMAVTIKPGKAWINGYFYVNDNDLILPVSVADGILNRIDRIVLRMDTVGREIKAVVKKGTLASSPVAQSLQRDSDAYEIALADISIDKGIISISQANITDLRLNKDLCGIVHGTVEQVDSTAIFNQYLDWYNTKKTAYDGDFSTWTTARKQAYDSWYNAITSREQSQIDAIESQFQADFNAWFAGIKSALAGDIAGNLLSKINAVPKVFRGTIAPTNPTAIDFWFKEI